MTQTANGILAVHPPGIPAELKELPQWVLWQVEERDGGQTKVPYSPVGDRAKTDDPSTWSRFDEAFQRYQEAGLAGIGFVFAAAGQLVGIDLDGCRNPDDGTIDSWALQLLERFPTYAEISPTGTGVKLFLKGSLPTEKTGKRTGEHNAPEGEGYGGKRPGIEAYQRGRFFAVTGRRLPASPASVMSGGEDLQAWFVDTFADRRPQGGEGLLQRFESAAGVVSGPLVGRAKAYLQKAEPAISGQRGHDAAYRIACRLRCDFGLSLDESLAALVDWNSRCEPPWSERELRHKLEDAAKEPQTNRLRDAPRHGYVNGYTDGVTMPTMDHVSQNGHSGATPSGSSAQGKPGGQGLHLEAITSGELDTGDFSVRYHIDQIVPVLQPGIVGGPSKALKTSLSVAALMSISSGDMFLDRFPVTTPARCCLISAESGFASLQRTGRSIAASVGRTLSDYHDLLWSDQILDLGSAGHVLELFRFVKDNGISVLGLDPAYLMMPGLGDQANNLFQMGSYLRGLTTIGQDCSCTIVLLHHFRKSLAEQFAEPELEWLAHAGFGNWARWWLLLNRRSKYDPEQRGRHELWLHAGGSAGHSSAWAVDVDEGLGTSHQWSVTVQYASEARKQQQDAAACRRLRRGQDVQAQKQSTARAKVADALKKFPNGGTKTDIAAVARVSKDVATGVLTDMQQEGTVSECRISKANKQCYDGFRLSDLVQRDSGTVPLGAGPASTPGQLSL